MGFLTYERDNKFLLCPHTVWWSPNTPFLASLIPKCVGNLFNAKHSVSPGLSAASRLLLYILGISDLLGKCGPTCFQFGRWPAPLWRKRHFLYPGHGLLIFILFIYLFFILLVLFIVIIILIQGLGVFSGWPWTFGIKWSRSSLLNCWHLRAWTIPLD